MIGLSIALLFPTELRNMLITASGLKWLGLIGLLLGISCSYTPLVQGSAGCRDTASRNGDKPFALFPADEFGLSQRRKLFKQAYTSFKLGDFQQALSGWLKLAGHYPELEDYVYHYLAQTEAALSQHPAAVTHWQELISRFPYSRLVPEARLGMADSYFMQGDFDRAILIYQQLLDQAWEDKGVRPGIYQKLARGYEQQGKFSQAMAAYHQLWLNHPASPQAEAAQQRIIALSREHSLPLPGLTDKDFWKRINRLILEGEYASASQELERFRKQFPASPLMANSYLKQAKCYLGQQKSSRAIEYLKGLIRRFSQHRLAAEARYRLARLYWNQGRNQRAENYLRQILRDDKARSWQDNAGYVLARIYEENRKYSKAIENYQQLIAKFPQSPWANIARWRLGWIHYCYLRDYAKASEHFAQVAPPSNNNSDLYYSARYWQGRCQEELKLSSQAVNLYTSLVEQAGYTYYAQLADQRLASLAAAGTPEQASYSVPVSRDELLVEADPFLISRLLTEEDRFHLERVRELAALLMFDDSLGELDAMTNPADPPLAFWYQLSQLYHLLGDYPKSIHLIQRVVDQAGQKGLKLPLEVWKVCYPLNYWPLIKKQAEATGLDPYLIAAVIRQESVFDPESLSAANAIGLMQVIPSTGRTIAQQLGITGFTPDMLYEPETNLALGSHYLARLIKKFNHNLVLALAAYNAGERATTKWWRERKSEDIAQFIENIPYPETRRYIKRVWSNYYNYRRIYQEE
jgi:soluble lytic murein transglycosylase